MLNAIMRFLGLTRWMKLPKSGGYGRWAVDANAVILPESCMTSDPCWVIYYKEYKQPVSFSKKPDFKRADEILARMTLMQEKYDADVEEFKYCASACYKAAQKYYREAS